MKNLFKRAAVFTDIHYGLRSNSEQHNLDCSNFIDWFIATARENGCETCLFLGDYHHQRATINVRTLQYMLRGLEKLDAAFERVYFIPGNHDLYHRSRRDVSSVEWAKHLKNTTVIDDFYRSGGVTIAPWLIGDDWKKIKGMGGEYLFGHFELPHFWMNAMVEMPDHGELQTEHLGGYSSVFSGHFHKRQTRGNVTYIGNAFPHNYADAGDDDRGMMTLEWGGVHRYHRWPGQPVYRVYKLSQVLEDPDRLLLPDSNVRVNLDIEISYEESAFIREQLMPKYSLRDMTLIPVKLDLGEDSTDYTGLQFESVDSIIINQIEQLQQGSFDRGLLLEIYKNL